MPTARKRKTPDVPFDKRRIPKEAIEPLCYAIGFIIVNWSHMEAALNGWVSVIYQMREGRKLAREMPHDLKRKLRFLKKAFKQIQALQDYSVEGLDHIAKVKSLSRIRHFLIHGSPSHYEPKNHTFIFVRMDRDRGMGIHKLKELTITVGELLDYGRESVSRSAAMISMAKSLLDPLIGKKGTK